MLAQHDFGEPEHGPEQNRALLLLERWANATWGQQKSTTEQLASELARAPLFGDYRICLSQPVRRPQAKETLTGPLLLASRCGGESKG